VGLPNDFDHFVRHINAAAKKRSGHETVVSLWQKVVRLGGAARTLPRLSRAAKKIVRKL